jgi:hypothetical protein
MIQLFYFESVFMVTSVECGSSYLGAPEASGYGSVIPTMSCMCHGMADGGFSGLASPDRPNRRELRYSGGRWDDCPVVLCCGSADGSGGEFC